MRTFKIQAASFHALSTDGAGGARPTAGDSLRSVRLMSPLQNTVRVERVSALESSDAAGRDEVFEADGAATRLVRRARVLLANDASELLDFVAAFRGVEPGLFRLLLQPSSFQLRRIYEIHRDRRYEFIYPFRVAVEGALALVGSATDLGCVLTTLVWVHMVDDHMQKRRVE